MNKKVAVAFMLIFSPFANAFIAFNDWLVFDNGLAITANTKQKQMLLYIPQKGSEDEQIMFTKPDENCTTLGDEKRLQHVYLIGSKKTRVKFLSRCAPSDDGMRITFPATEEGKELFINEILNNNELIINEFTLAVNGFRDARNHLTSWDSAL